jgi:N-methylhydantoinase A
MANAIREITVEQGVDPRRTTLVAFGGAGPLFATLLARELELTKILIPPYAGNFSAWGLLGADLTQSAALTRITRLDNSAVDGLNGALSDLFDALVSRARDAGAGTGREIGFDMRYVGQEHTLTIGVPAERGRVAASVGEIHDLFTREYDRTFGHSMEEAVEIVSIRATLRTPLPRRAQERVLHVSPDGRHRTSFEAYSFTRGEPLDFAIVERTSLADGTEIEGPAIIIEDTATTYLDAGFTARQDESGSLFLTDEEG